MKLFDNALTLLEQSLDVRLYRQNVLASNAANIDTPGFLQKEVDFRSAMERAMEPDAPSAHDAARDATFELVGQVSGPDGNTVDLDQTMVSLAENGLQYGAAARAAGKKLAMLRYVASEGNG